MEVQPIQHVWTHTDSDLVDLSITYQSQAQHGKATPTGQSESSEVVHTTSEHPFLTDHGFVPAGKLRVGMHIRREDGSVGVVTATRLVHRTQTMYNLEVAHDHTFVVGAGQWVVHNQCNRPYLRRRIPGLSVPYQAQHIIPCQTAYGQNPHSLVTTALNGAMKNWLNEA